MLRYYKLFDLLNRRDMKKTDLLEVLSAPTLAKISKGKNIQTDVIDKICLFLECQPGDIMEYFYHEPEEDEPVSLTGRFETAEEFEKNEKMKAEFIKKLKLNRQT